MLERIEDIKKFDYIKLLDYLKEKQYNSVTLITPGARTNFFCHVRETKKDGVPVRDLDGQQMRILLESLGIKVNSLVREDAYLLNLRFKCENYVESIPDDSLIIMFSFGNFFGGPNGDAYKWMRAFIDSKRDYLWVYNDVRMNPSNGQFTHLIPELADSKTIGMMDGCTFHVNYNVDMLKDSSIQPTTNRFCYIGGNRGDLKKRLRCFNYDNTDCFGMKPGTVITLPGRKKKSKKAPVPKPVEDDFGMFSNGGILAEPEVKEEGLVFNSPIPPSEIVDKYSNYIATIFTTSAEDISHNITPRLFETMCSNAVVLFDIASDLDDELAPNWKFRKVTDNEDAAKKLQILINDPVFRQTLLDEQHAWIRHLNDWITK